MSSYLDPMSALQLARAARQDEIRAAELYHLVHSLDARPAARRRG